MRRPGRSALRRRSRPSEWRNFAVAFSRTAQVLRNTKSAAAALAAASRPRDCSSPATLSESLTFIWQPNVWMKKVRGDTALGFAFSFITRIGLN